MNNLYLVIYYFFAKFLPSNSTKIIGKLSKQFRYKLCQHLFKKCGKNVNIEQGAYFGTGKNIEIGDNSGIGINCKIYNTVKIGKYVMMGPEVMIIGGNHKYDRLDVPIGLQGSNPIQPLHIGDDVWIGARATILGNVQRIGNGAIIGGGAVVTKPVPEYAIVGGNPAKIIKYRKKINENS